MYFPVAAAPRFGYESHLSREEMLTLEHSLLPIVSGDGTLQGAVAVFHDITELKKMDQVRRDFVANVSHELRTPLNAITGYARLLRGGILSGDKAARGLETLDYTFVAADALVLKSAGGRTHRECACPAGHRSRR